MFNFSQIFIKIRNQSKIQQYSGACVNEYFGKYSEIEHLYDLKHITPTYYLSFI